MVFVEAEGIPPWQHGWMRKKLRPPLRWPTWSHTQESLFRMWDSAEQANQITTMGDTEPNSEDEDHWVANYGDTSSNDGGDHSMAAR